MQTDRSPACRRHSLLSVKPKLDAPLRADREHTMEGKRDYDTGFDYLH